MKNGIVAAWVAGTAIVAWRAVHAEHRIPAPGVLLGISALFMAGALISDIAPQSESLVLAVLVGLDVAALLNVLPAGLGGQIGQAQTAEAKALLPAAAEGGSPLAGGSGGASLRQHP